MSTSKKADGVWRCHQIGKGGESVLIHKVGLSGESGLVESISGHATPEGTGQYFEEGVKKGVVPGHFRDILSMKITSLGVGTYLGEADSSTDLLEKESIRESVRSGVVNVIDTAINYRFQKAERSVGRAVASLVESGETTRPQLFICTKNGYLTSDADVNSDFWSYIHRELIKPGKLKVDDIAGEVHSMTPSFLRDQLERSRRNIGIECVDLVYLHNAAESWLPEIGYRRFLERLADVFSLYEGMRTEGKLRYYGLATWTCFRVPRGEPAHVNLDDVVDVAKNAAGEDHGFRFIQVPFNPAMNEAMTLKSQRIADERVSTLDAAQQLGIAVVTSAPLGQGRMLSHPRVPEVAGSKALGLLQFARSAHPAIATVLVGQKEAAHVKENIEVGKLPPLDPAQFAETFDGLVEKP